MPDDDRLFKLKDICSALLYRFQALHSFAHEVSIYESMVLSRERLVFRQYIPAR